MLAVQSGMAVPAFHTQIFGKRAKRGFGGHML